MLVAEQHSSFSFWQTWNRVKVHMSDDTKASHGMTLLEQVQPEATTIHGK